MEDDEYDGDDDGKDECVHSLMHHGGVVKAVLSGDEAVNVAAVEEQEKQVKPTKKEGGPQVLIV